MLLIRHIPYEYWKEAALEGRLKISKPSEFNDPYDCVGHGGGLISYDVLDRWAENNPRVVKAKWRWGALSRGQKTWDSLVAERQRKYGEIFNRLLAKRTSIDKIFRVMCFSDPAKIIGTSADMLMWSHYAEKGKGVRIWIDICTDRMLGWEVKAVHYCDNVPQCDFSCITSLPSCQYIDDFFENVVYTKGIAWSYEAEYRLLTVTKYHLPCLHLREDERQVDKLVVPLDLIKRVDFGPAVGDEFENDMLEVQRK